MIRIHSSALQFSAGSETSRDPDGTLWTTTYLRPFGDQSVTEVDAGYIISNPDRDIGINKYVRHAKIDGDILDYVWVGSQTPPHRIKFIRDSYTREAGGVIQHYEFFSGTSIGDLVDSTWYEPLDGSEPWGFMTYINDISINQYPDRFNRGNVQGHRISWRGTPDNVTGESYQWGIASIVDCSNSGNYARGFSADFSSAINNVWNTWDDDCYNGVIEAFSSAVDGITPLDTNNIANILSIKELLLETPKKIGELVVRKRELGNFFDIKKMKSNIADLKDPPLQYLKKKNAKSKASSAWLTWRYVYNTTKADIEEHMHGLQSAIDHVVDLRLASGKYHGNASRNGWQICYTMYAEPTHFTNTLEELWYQSRQLGMQINATNVWDMIPFSFVADWFLPIGSIANQLDNSLNYDRQHWTFSNLVWSRKKSESVTALGYSFNVTCYERVPCSTTPGFFFKEESHPSYKTICKRIIDGVALIFG